MSAPDQTERPAPPAFMRKYFKTIVTLIAVTTVIAITYSWTFTPHGRLDYRAALSLHLLSFNRTIRPDPGSDFEMVLPVNLIYALSFALPKEDVYKQQDIAIPGQGVEIPARVYWPTAAQTPDSPLPVIVFFHGGGFVVGSIDIFDSLTRALANATSAIVVSVGYRLAPAHPYPAAVDDAYAALQWVADNIGTLGGDPTRLIVSGESAGGTLATVVALKARDLGGPDIAAQVLYYPGTDISDDSYPSVEKFADGYGLSSAAVSTFRQAYIGHVQDKTDPYISPLRAASLAHMPPALIITAGFDPLTDATAAYATRLQQSGGTVTHRHYATTIHGFMNIRVFPQRRLALTETGKFLQVLFSDAARAMHNPRPSSVAGWDELIESLHSLPHRMLDKLPEAMRSDQQIQQEVGRLALEALTSVTIDALGGDGDFPVFLPALGQVLNVGQPNADTVYRAARITPGGSYRLRGERGTLRMANIGQVVPRGAETGSGRSYLDINTLAIDSHGRFDLLLSPSRPEGYTGDWWELRPETYRLVLRLVSSDWAAERSPTLSIERIDAPMGLPRRSADDLERRLRALPTAVSGMASMFVDHVTQLRNEGYINKLKMFDMTDSGGLVGQSYYEGAYEVADDEALIVATKVPAQCLYRSLILTNDLWETIDWYNNHSSLNDAQSSVDGDGVLRIVVSSKDPGVPNWLDTAGHSRGLIQGRWTECDSQPLPSVRKVALADIRKYLPAETPTITLEQREQIIRERRTALQQRPLW